MSIWPWAATKPLQYPFAKRTHWTGNPNLKAEIRILPEFLPPKILYSSRRTPPKKPSKPKGKAKRTDYLTFLTFSRAWRAEDLPPALSACRLCGGLQFGSLLGAKRLRRLGLLSAEVAPEEGAVRWLGWVGLVWFVWLDGGWMGALDKSGVFRLIASKDCRVHVPFNLVLSCLKYFDASRLREGGTWDVGRSLAVGNSLEDGVGHLKPPVVNRTNRFCPFFTLRVLYNMKKANGEWKNKGINRSTFVL